MVDYQTISRIYRILQFRPHRNLITAVAFSAQSLCPSALAPLGLDVSPRGAIIRRRQGFGGQVATAGQASRPTRFAVAVGDGAAKSAFLRLRKQEHFGDRVDSNGKEITVRTKSNAFSRGGAERRGRWDE